MEFDPLLCRSIRTACPRFPFDGGAGEQEGMGIWLHQRHPLFCFMPFIGAGDDVL
jgi:hypothetical protein